VAARADAERPLSRARKVIILYPAWRAAEAGSRAGHCDFPALLLVNNVLRTPGFSFEWQVLQPPVHDTVAFGEETMATKVDAIPLIVDSSRNAPHVRAFFQDYGDNVGTAEQFVGGG